MARQFVKFSFFRVDRSFRVLDPEVREAAKKDLAEALEEAAERFLVRVYSTVGTRGDCDLLVWSASESLDDIVGLHARMASTALGPYLEIPHSFLAMTRRSQYVGGHRHAGQEGTRLRLSPGTSRYLFVYPFWKTRAWYALPREERQRMMDEHIAIGHEFPSVRLNTTYSFGLDDQEFVLAFETDEPADFLDLVERLRGAETSMYTLRDTPIFTCVKATTREVLDAIG